MGVREREPIVVPAFRSAQRDFGLDPCRGFRAAVELIVGAAVHLDELPETSRPEHAAQHLEEADEVGLPRAVGADENRGRRKVRQLDLGQGTEALDSDAFQLDSIRHDCSSVAMRGKRFEVRHGSTIPRGRSISAVRPDGEFGRYGLLRSERARFGFHGTRVPPPCACAGVPGAAGAAPSGESIVANATWKAPALRSA